MSNVLWAVQTKLLQEDSTRFLVEAFQKFGINWAAFPLPPYARHIPDFKWDGPIIYYGSTSLVQLVHNDPALRAKAALFYSEKHRPEYYGRLLGESWLNHDCRITTIAAHIAQEQDPDREWFIKPNGGLKDFSGKVYQNREFCELVDRLQNNKMVDDLASIIVSEPVRIAYECRTWSIGGEVPAVVGYKKGLRIDPWVLDEDEQEEIRAFAKEESQKLKELGAFVLDVARMADDSLRVVEINCIHSAGFYLTDHISDVVADLSLYVRKSGGQHG